MYLRNIKLAKKINSLKEMLNDDTIAYHVDEVGLKQSKITSFFAKKSVPLSENCKNRL